MTDVSLTFARAFAYCFYGWVVEVMFNGLRRAFFERPTDWRLEATTHIWAGVGYAVGGLLFEPVHDALRPYPFFARGAVYLAGFYALEYAIGWLVRRLAGRAPWEYSGRLSVHGLIQLGYAPFWLAFLFWMERVHDALVATLPGFLSALART